MDISIVIVNWHSRDHLRRCLSSLQATSAGIDYEVVVIDSGSFDGSGKMLGREFPDARFLQADRNLGFARANNRAFEATTGRSVLFLNPDTELLGPVLATLSEVLAVRPDAGLVGCTVFNADGSRQWSSIQRIPTIANQLLDIEWLQARWPFKHWRPEGGAPRGGESVASVEALAGSCMLARREAFEAVGRFSDDYFMYAEDVDLSYKMRRGGWSVYYTPAASIRHFGGGSSDQAAGPFATVMMKEAVWRFLRKTRGQTYAGTYRAAMLAAGVARIAVAAPFAVLGPATRRARAVVRKWAAVCSWVCGCDGIVPRFYQSEDLPADRGL